MVLNATFNNILAILWQLVLLVEETRVPGENHWSATSNWQTFITKCCIKYTSPEQGSNSQRKVVIGTDCIGSYKSNYHTIMSTTAPENK